MLWVHKKEHNKNLSICQLYPCPTYYQDEKKNILGIVKNVEEFPAQITLRVSRKNGKDFFVPFIKQFIKNVDIRNKQIEIVVLEGML